MSTKKASAKNARAKRIENIEWLIKVTVRQPKNKEAFDKSYFGQLKLKNDVDTRQTNNS